MDRLLDFLKRPFLAIEDEALRRLVLAVSGGNDEPYKPSFEGVWAALGNAMGEPLAKTLVIPIEGVLTPDEPWYGTTYNSIQNGLERAAADDISRVILAVDSPGGDVTGLPETAAMVASVAKHKPVTALVSGMSASAAYWLSSQARDIVLTPSGEVGSVGVRTMHVDVTKMLENVGIKVTEMYAGIHKTEFSPFAPLSQESKDYMQGTLDALHQQFMSAIVSGRGSRVSAEFRKAHFGEGRMFMAEDARVNGLVDAVASTRDFYSSLVPPSSGIRVEDSGLTRARVEVEKIKF